MKPTAILMNTKAGFLKLNAGKEEMERMAKMCDVDCEVIETSSAAMMRATLAKLVKEKRPRVAVAGGDGTIHLAVQQVAKSDTALGIIAQGTANNFANALRLPEDLPSALRVLADGEVKEVDLGYVHGQYFTEAAGVGLFADMLAMYGGANKNFFRGLYAVLRMFIVMKSSRIRLVADGKVIQEHAVFCACANSYRMAHSLPVAPGAKITDGLLDLVILGDLARNELIPYYRALRAQMHPALPKTSMLQAKEIHIESRRKMPVHCDDQILGTTPATFTTEAGSLKVLVEKLSRLATIWGRLKGVRHERALHLLIGLALVFLCLSFVIHLPAVADFDLNVTTSLQTVRQPVLDTVVEGISLLGNTLTLIIGAVFAIGFLIAYKHPKAAWLTALTLLGLPLNILLKAISQRPRPGADVVDVLLPTIGLSFPSGHAMASTMFFGFLAYLSWTEIAKPRKRFLMVTIFAVMPLLISLSRVYVGAHWFSDVFGGMTAGLFFLMPLMIVYRRWAKSSEEGA